MRKNDPLALKSIAGTVSEVTERVHHWTLKLIAYWNQTVADRDRSGRAANLYQEVRPARGAVTPTMTTRGEPRAATGGDHLEF